MDIAKLVGNHALTALETEILTDMIENRDLIRGMGIRGLAGRHYTSTTTIMRLAKKLGFRGFTDMCYGLYSRIGSKPEPVRDTIPFIHQFIDCLQEIPINYDPICQLAHQLYQQKAKMIYICGMGFSCFPADYFAKKLMVQGIKCIFSGAEESIGIFENNLEDIGIFIAVSKSGETDKILERVKRAKEHGMLIASFTSSPVSHLGHLSDLLILMDDAEALDDKNLLPSFFFAGVMFKMELVILELKKIKGNPPQ